jgi:hypothetical protein
MFVVVEWQSRSLAVPLEQLLPINSDEETLEAIQDWHYWIERGINYKVQTNLYMLILCWIKQRGYLFLMMFLNYSK